MTDKMMLLQAVRLILCLLGTFVSNSQASGLDFSIVRIPDDVYCGHLQCLIDINQTDSHIASIIGLTIFDVTQVNARDFVASLSVFAPYPSVEQTKVHVINATGSISEYHADLALGFMNHSDCQDRSYQCELNFVNVDGVPDVIREVVTSGSNENCPAIMDQLLEIATQLKIHSDVTDRQLTELRTDMETKFNNVLGQLSKLERLLNSSVDTVPVDTVQKSCVKGMSSSQPTEKFLLWGTVEALCDTQTDGGGWIVIQRRTKGDEDFLRGWNDYKKGFGTPTTDFWIGNDIIHNLTSHGYTELRIDLEYQGSLYFAHYSKFSVSDESSKYQLSVSGYSGTAGDALTHHDQSYFSTYDKDNDIDYSRNCALMSHGAWWYVDCYYSNLNGLWGAQDERSIIWRDSAYWTGIAYTEMKIRFI